MSKTVSQNARQTAKNTSIFSFFTVVSRLFGLLRDMLKAHAFGTGIASVAFDIAFRLPNMLRNLVAEGALSQAFVPIYQQYREKNDTHQERVASGNVLGIFLLLIGALSIAVIFVMPKLIPLLISDHDSSLELTALTITLAQILFPYILLMSLASIYMSIQYSYQSFAAASFGPALLNLVILTFFSIYYFFMFPKQNSTDSRNQAIYVFAAVTLLAAVVQLGFQAYTVKRMGVFPILGFRFRHPVVKNIFNMMLPAVFAASVQEIGQLFDIALAAKLYDKVPEAVSALTYAHRLIQLPIGVFAVAVATASLPQLSQIFLSGNREEFSESLFDSLQLNLFLLLPATLGLIFFAAPIVGLIFEHGQFNHHSTQVTSLALVYYAPSVTAFGLQKLFMNSLYARRNSKTPAWITFFTLVLNVLLSLYFMRTLLHAGLALSTSLSAFFAVAVYWVLYIRSGMIIFSTTRIFALVKIFALNIVFAILLFYVSRVVQDFSYLLQTLLILPLAFSYGLLAFLFGLQEWFLFLEILKKLKDRLFK